MRQVSRTAFVATMVVAGATACDAPPRGEALVVVDTDMPVPNIVDHLRVDVYSADGSRWWVSRDIYLPDPKSWPASFSVYSDDTSVGSSALVRLRAYRSGYVQDYRGASVVTLPALGTPWSASDFASCCAGDCASLCPTFWQPQSDCSTPPCLASGDTPTTEPQPLVTIDRLVRIDLVPGVRGRVSVLLAGACAGTPAVIPDPARADPSPTDMQTCVDTERTLVPVTPSALAPDMTRPPIGSSAQGAFEKPFQTPCPPLDASTIALDDEVCVPGGVMIFGSNTGLSAAEHPRIAAVPTFVMDAYEFSVARFRAAVAGGFKAPGLVVLNDGLANDASQPVGFGNCTAYSDPKWSTPDRDAEALNCIDYASARALCKLRGEDLPTEAQWEYAASVAGRAEKSFITFLPRPNDLPECSDASFARSNSPDNPAFDECWAESPSFFGVARVDYGDDLAGPPAQRRGTLVGMGGNVSELVLDADASTLSNCWLSQPIASPSCVRASSTQRLLRGGAWNDNARAVTTEARATWSSNLTNNVAFGFRCAR